jgi:hypothetical protein
MFKVMGNSSTLALHWAGWIDGIVGLNQINRCFPRHNILHLAQKLFSAGELFGTGLLEITESELLAAPETKSVPAITRVLSRVWLGFSRASLGDLHR